MKLVDLHVHSNASDGSLSPSEVVRCADEKGLKAIALTDHDTVSGIDEALSASVNLELEVIPGIEVSCYYSDVEIHVLGLYIDNQSETLLSFLKWAVDRRVKRNEVVLKAFQDDGFEITMKDLVGDNPDTTVTRAHFAHALLAHGYVNSVEQAFKKYLNPGRPYYRMREMITPEQAFAAITAAGSFPILAHPCQYKLGWNGIEKLILYLKPLGLRGLECFHSSNNSEESRKLYNLARKHNLAVTGGSDFHGAAKPDIELGSGRGNLRVPASYLDELKLAMFLTPSANI